MIHTVIMAGGTGTRFWPLSRIARPKQLLDLGSGRTMIQATVDRLAGIVPAERTWVITNRSLVDSIARQLPQLAGERIVGEPCKRDTAPAIGLAAFLIAAHVEPKGATMVVMPSDHLIQPSSAFQAAIRQAIDFVEAEPETLVTFGIKPGYAAETFGYIERGNTVDTSQPAAPTYSAFHVRKFHEKPARSIAEQYLAQGNYYWNSGIFVWKVDTILRTLRQYEPEMAQHLHNIVKRADPSPAEFASTLDREFTAIRGKSIDYAVMERHQPVVVIEAPFAWDDVGSWQALARSQGADSDGNTVVGRHLGIRTSGSIVYTSGEHLVVTLGLDDTIVVHTPDATLVADKSQEEAIREVVKELEARDWREYL
jgi:mannose-1-phosphate guanylyltransferase